MQRNAPHDRRYFLLLTKYNLLLLLLMNILLDHLAAAPSWILAQAPVVVDPGAGAMGHRGIMGWVYTLVIGLVIGVIAKFLTPGRDPGGCIITSLIGIAGSFVAYFVFGLLGFYRNGETPGFIASVIGAVILLAIYHMVMGRRGGTPS
jgi:uncharacterized membrane protein YeaQ/YmgE (transglycosylase-associated protein family)